MELKKIKLPFKIKKPILALGGQRKNTICFAKENFAFLSPVYADLSIPGDFVRFEQNVRYFLKKRPKIIAYDLHPEYQSTKFALSLTTDYHLLSTQHHHAHIASCMADNGLLNQMVIGVVFDGTGLGRDNAFWGAEFFCPCDYRDFKRMAHLKEIPLLGGERAILQPWRLSTIWFYLIYKEKFENLGLGLLKKIDRQKWQVLKRMYLSGYNCPLASSMGRLFDAVGNLVLEKDKIDFEAELAIGLEKLATDYKLPATSYKFRIIKNKDEYIIDPTLMFRQIFTDLKAKESRKKIAYRFHLTVAQMVINTCLTLRKQSNINKIVLSGGVFQNSLLLRLSLDLLYKQGFKVFTHRYLSCGDSSLSLGQAMLANFNR